ncbi:MAG TPA: hypothetical protein VF837_03850 [Patescibacteria group bacterium]
MDHSSVLSSWFVLALIAAFIAGTKNRSGLNWFLLTIIFGPIALICLILFCDTVKKE